MLPSLLPRLRPVRRLTISSLATIVVPFLCRLAPRTRLRPWSEPADLAPALHFLAWDRPHPHTQPLRAHFPALDAIEDRAGRHAQRIRRLRHGQVLVHAPSLAYYCGYTRQ